MFFNREYFFIVFKAMTFSYLVNIFRWKISVYNNKILSLSLDTVTAGER